MMSPSQNEFMRQFELMNVATLGVEEGEDQRGLATNDEDLQGLGNPDDSQGLASNSEDLQRVATPEDNPNPDGSAEIGRFASPDEPESLGASADPKLSAESGRPLMSRKTSSLDVSATPEENASLDRAAVLDESADLQESANLGDTVILNKSASLGDPASLTNAAENLVKPVNLDESSSVDASNVSCDQYDEIEGHSELDLSSSTEKSLESSPSKLKLWTPGESSEDLQMETLKQQQRARRGKRTRISNRYLIRKFSGPTLLLIISLSIPIHTIRRYEDLDDDVLSPKRSRKGLTDDHETITCPTCLSRTPQAQFGKHLISHYHLHHSRLGI